jgi:hypothetical protein
MRKPATADERERRIIEYLTTVHQGRIAEFKLTRLNRIANFRKKLMELLDELIETRAEDLAAGMLMQYAPPRPERKEGDILEGRLPIPPKRARRPVWMRGSEDRRGRVGTRKVQ